MNTLWSCFPMWHHHYGDVIMGTIASQITSLTIVYSTVYSGADQRKHQSSASLAFERGIHRGPVNSPHKWPVTRKMFPFDDVIMTPQSWLSHDQVITGPTLTSRIVIQNAEGSFGSVSIHFAILADFTNRRKMTGRYIVRMLFLFNFVEHVLTSTDDYQCQGCQTPLIQNRQVPWWHLLKTRPIIFFGLMYRGMIQILPKNSFVAGPSIQVCVRDSRYKPQNVLVLIYVVGVTFIILCTLWFIHHLRQGCVNGMLFSVEMKQPRRILKEVFKTHWGRAKMAAIFQTTFSNACSWMRMYEFRLRFHWNVSLWLELTIFQHWFR